MKRVCVFCGSSAGSDALYAHAATELADHLAELRIGLVYGGGNVGLMGVMADRILEHGGEVIGIIPDQLVKREVAHHDITELHVVGSMHERKAMMAELADGFITLPGGFGTLEELFEAVTWAQLGIHRKPCAILNANNYFAHLLDYIEHAIDQSFIKPEYRDLIITGSTPVEVVHLMRNYEPTTVEKWMR